MIFEFVCNVFLFISMSFVLDIFYQAFFEKKPKSYNYIFNIVYVVWQIFIAYFSELSLPLNLFITLLIIIMIAKVNYEGSNAAKVFFAIIFCVLGALSEVLVGYMFLRRNLEYSIPILLGSAISKSVLVVIIIMLRYLVKGSIIKFSKSIYQLLLYFIPVGSVYVIYSIFMLTNEIQTSKNAENYAMVVIIMIGINIIAFYIYIRLAKELVLERTVLLYEQQIKLYNSQIEEQQQSMKAIQKIRHDFKHHITFIETLNLEKKYDELALYLEELKREKWTTDFSVSDNIIEKFVFHKKEIAVQKGIKFQSTINIPYKLNFAMTDLCVIIGNILDNAIEAACMQKDEQSYIETLIRTEDNNLLIIVKNSFDGKINHSGNKILTRKTEKEYHGIGLESVEYIVNKYHGMLKIEYDDKEFIVRILLYNISE